MNIAIVGTRGIPNRYGGFERFAEQISSRFADHGHQRHRLLPPRLHPPRRYLRSPRAPRHRAQPAPEASRHLGQHALRRHSCRLRRQRRHPAVQRGEQPVRLHSAALRQAGGAQCGRPRPQAREVERPGRAGAALLRMDVVVQLQPTGDRRHAPSTTTTSRSTAASRWSSATAPRRPKVRPQLRRRGQRLQPERLRS